MFYPAHGLFLKKIWKQKKIHKNKVLSFLAMCITIKLNNFWPNFNKGGKTRKNNNLLWIFRLVLKTKFTFSIYNWHVITYCNFKGFLYNNNCRQRVKKLNCVGKGCNWSVWIKFQILTAFSSYILWLGKFRRLFSRFFLTNCYLRAIWRYQVRLHQMVHMNDLYRRWCWNQVILDSSEGRPPVTKLKINKIVNMIQLHLCKSFLFVFIKSKLKVSYYDCLYSNKKRINKKVTVRMRSLFFFCVNLPAGRKQLELSHQICKLSF